MDDKYRNTFFQDKALCWIETSIKKDCPCFIEILSVESVNVNMGLKASQEVSDNYNSSQKMAIDGKVQPKIIDHFSLRKLKLKP